MSKEWGKTPTAPPSIDYNTVINYKMPQFSYKFDEKDVILYALGIGFGQNECISQPTLANTYESNENFGIFPSFAVIPPFQAIANVVGIPGLSFNPMMLLHGETEFILHKPASQIPTCGEMLTNAVVSNVLDKKSGASIELTANTTYNGEILFTNVMTLFIRGLGGFAGPNTPQNSRKSIIPLIIQNPTLHPQYVTEYQTTPQQALLYRLSGDFNPLHIDPQLAAAGGFSKQPILHGLCTLGFSVRGVVSTICEDNRDLIHSVKCRFIKPVLPGQKLVVEVHSVQIVDQQNVVYFTTKARNYNDNITPNEKLPVVLSGYAILHDKHEKQAKL